jgi:hypothetical protein
MGFTIQYFATVDRLICVESVDAVDLDYAIDRARAVIKQSMPALEPAGDPQLIGYVILDQRGRQVARGYRRDV